MTTGSLIEVLVIEDNPLNLELVTDLLEASGCAVCHAQTAEEGLRLALSTLPDAILMDISLPGMDGLAATKALRANPAICHLPVIALTAHAMKGDEENALNAGCDGYLAKPIDTRTFVARLLGLIKAANSRQTKIQPPVNEHAN